MPFLKGDWGDRLTALFNFKQPVQWILSRGIMPTVDVGNFVSDLKTYNASGTGVDQLTLTVPDGKRWYVWLAEVQSSASGGMALYVVKNGLTIGFKAASGVTLNDKVSMFLDQGDMIRGDGALGNLTLEVLVFEHDVEHP